MKKTVLLLACTVAVLAPRFGLQWEQQPTAPQPGLSPHSAEATQAEVGACALPGEWLPRLEWVNTSMASADLFSCNQCISDFEECYFECEMFGPGTPPDEVVCQENCVMTLSNCLATCRF